MPSIYPLLQIQVELKINSTGLTGLYISIHNQNAFLPSNGVKFGTDLAFIGLNRPKTKTLTQQVFNIKINNKTRLPTKKYPCNKKSSFVHGGLRKCWMDYVQTEIACLPPGNIWELAAAAAGSQSRYIIRARKDKQK